MLQARTTDEIALIEKAALLVSRTHAEVARHLGVGVSLVHLDRIAHDFIFDNGGIPAFLNYRGTYPYTLCTSVNNIVVHGFPTEYELQPGDIVSVDCGVNLNGYFGDSAYTYTVGDVSAEVQDLLRVTRECLYIGMAVATPGNRTGDIGAAIQDHAEAHGYGVVRELCGHGVGLALHEKPDVPNYGRRGSGVKLIDGLVLAIEPMINLGTRNVQQMNEWEITTADRKPSAHFEHTVVVRKGGAIALSSFEPIDAVIALHQPETIGQTGIH